MRELIDRALSAGQLHDPDGEPTQWQLRSSQQSVMSTKDREKAL